MWDTAVIREVKERGVLRVATEPTFKPFEFRNDKNQLAGFDIDLARAIGGEIGVKVEFVEVAWESIIPTLLGRKADLIMSGMTATPERALTVSYSDPYFVTSTCVLVSKKRASDVKQASDLNRDGRIITVKEGTTGAFAAKKQFPKAKVVSFSTQNDAAREVALGRADAFIYDLWQIENHQRNNPDSTFIIDKPITREPYAIACRKGDPESVAWLNLVIRTLRLDGRLQELYDKYGLRDAR